MADEFAPGEIISGPALRAAVAGAEGALTGALFKTIFMKQLGMDELVGLDLRGHDELAPMAAPLHPRRVDVALRVQVLATEDACEDAQDTAQEEE